MNQKKIKTESSNGQNEKKKRSKLSKLNEKKEDLDEGKWIILEDLLYE